MRAVDAKDQHDDRLRRRVCLCHRGKVQEEVQAMARAVSKTPVMRGCKKAMGFVVL